VYLYGKPPNMGKRIVYFNGDIIGECLFIKDLPNEGTARMAEFKCHCGAVFENKINWVRSGAITQCKSCAKKTKTNVLIARNTSHGKAHSLEYNSWAAMKQRCYYIKNKQYKDYGGRGITVCERWKNSFEAFLADMGHRPFIGATIERRNNGGNYDKDNCYWGTRTEQNRNTRRSNFITYNGETKLLIHWAEQFGINRRCLHHRIFSYGWDIEKALTTPSLFKKGYVKTALKNIQTNAG